MNPIPIPFNKPSFVGPEFEYIATALRGGHLSGDGAFTERCQTFLEQALGVARVLLTISCTHALEMAALLMNVETGDEVIVPSFTFVFTVNAFVLRGARPVFIDSRSDTLNMDERLLDDRVSSRTRAIVPVHYAGVGCEMDAITAIAERRGVAIVEDNAHGLFARYKARYLGTFGCLATQSFHETKNISCGEGGALLVNRPDLAERAEVLVAKGTNRKQFLRGQVDKYTWVDLGSSYRPSELLAAVLYAQLEAYEDIQHKRRRIWERYRRDLSDWATASGIGLPVVPGPCEQSYHIFYIMLPTPEAREALIRHLTSRGIMAVFHYQPLHLSTMGQRYGGRAGECPVAEAASQRLLRLPFYNDLAAAEQDRVVDAVREFRAG